MSNNIPVPRYKRNTCYTTKSGNKFKILESVYAFKKNYRDEKSPLVKFSTSTRQSLPGVLERNYGITESYYTDPQKFFIIYKGEGFKPDGTRITSGTGPNGEPIPFKPYYVEMQLNEMIEPTVKATLCVKSPTYNVGNYSITYMAQPELGGIKGTVGSSRIPIYITAQYYSITDPAKSFNPFSKSKVIQAVNNNVDQPEVNALFVKYTKEEEWNMLNRQYNIYYDVKINGKDFKLNESFLDSCDMQAAMQLPEIAGPNQSVAGGKRTRKRKSKKSRKNNPKVRKSMKN